MDWELIVGSREISRSGVGPFALACVDSCMGVG